MAQLALVAPLIEVLKPVSHNGGLSCIKTCTLPAASIDLERGCKLLASEPAVVLLFLLWPGILGQREANTEM